MAMCTTLSRRHKLSRKTSGPCLREMLWPGDKIAIWRTRDRSGNRGVVAFAEVTSSVEMLEEPDASHAFWGKGRVEGPRRRLRLRYLPSSGLPLWLDEHEDFRTALGQGRSGKQALRSYTGTLGWTGGKSRELSFHRRPRPSLCRMHLRTSLSAERTLNGFSRRSAERTTWFSGGLLVSGKSFMAKRLAYALIGRKDPTKVEVVQFHQSYSYEDFIQGFRLLTTKVSSSAKTESSTSFASGQRARRSRTSSSRDQSREP